MYLLGPCTTEDMHSKCMRRWFDINVDQPYEHRIHVEVTFDARVVDDDDKLNEVRIDRWRYIAQVRARAAGIVQRRLFSEGSDVKAGQPLFRIDDAPYRATLAAAQATLARAEANVLQTRAQAERYKPLAEANAVSQQEYIAAQAAFKQAEADVASAKAAVQTAQINLGYTSVSAPIAGRIGRALVTEGALVGQGEATQLAVVQQIDPLYVNFTQSADEVLRLRAAIAGGSFQSAGPAGSVAVSLVLDDGSVYPQRGKLLFSDLSVDPGTGQITLRAEVPNPKGALLPGSELDQARADRERTMASGSASMRGALLLGERFQMPGPGRAMQLTQELDGLRGDGLAPYLAARQLMGESAYAAALVPLRVAERRGLPLPSLVREHRRMLAATLYALGRWSELDAHLSGPMAEDPALATLAAYWRARLEFREGATPPSARR